MSHWLIKSTSFSSKVVSVELDLAVSKATRKIAEWLLGVQRSEIGGGGGWLNPQEKFLGFYSGSFWNRMHNWLIDDFESKNV